jgi:hypothetical protein
MPQSGLCQKMKNRSFIVSGSLTVSISHRVKIPFLYRARERVDQKHPVVNVLIYSQDNAAPVSFIDNKGVLRGIAADLFSVVSLRTGLQFRFETGSTTEELIQKVNESSADTG